ncbi:MAG TPA: hypothetical protein PKA06_14480, partial [Gemmatales bacterium]|nr:hypothetical protein [Gemmatales bacterium]
MRALSLLLATLWFAFPLMAQPNELPAEQREYQQEKEAALQSSIHKLYPPNVFKNLSQLEAGLAKSPDSSTLLKQARWMLPDPNSVVPAHVSRIMGSLKFKHDQHATSILYTPDDTGLLTCSRDGTVRLWNLHNGLAAKTWNLGAPLGAMSLSPDGKLLAVAEGYRLYPRIDLSSFPSQEEYAIHLIDLQAGSVVAKLTGIRAPILALSFSADGKQLACGGQPVKGEPLHIWNVARRELSRSFKSIHTINNLAWSNTGTRLFCTSSNKSIDIFDVTKGEQIQSVQERGTLYAMALSPDQEYLAVGGDITEENNYQVIRIYFI